MPTQKAVQSPDPQSRECRVCRVRQCTELIDDKALLNSRKKECFAFYKRFYSPDAFCNWFEGIL